VFPDKPLTGMTPKFKCDLGKGDEVKVKCGEKNGEVYAEVAASRLLWALGFQADVMCPRTSPAAIVERSVSVERRRLAAAAQARCRRKYSILRSSAKARRRRSAGYEVGRGRAR
jgi:hypothetical protein